MRIIVTADGSRTLSSPTYGETYGSTNGAMSEALHVYLQGSGVERRLATHLSTRVLEVGFGTGLNFLVTAAAALSYGTPVHYLALERDLLDADTIHEVHRGVAALRDAVAELTAQLSALHATNTVGRQRLTFGPHADVVLELVLGNALDAGRAGYLDGGEHGYDAIYLDAFSPKANPELWTDRFLTELAGSLAPGGTLATFSVSGAVRRALSRAGLHVSKLPGPPGGKAEMLRAVNPESLR